jgi:hypothetical protein
MAQNPIIVVLGIFFLGYIVSWMLKQIYFHFFKTFSDFFLMCYLWTFQLISSCTIEKWYQALVDPKKQSLWFINYVIMDYNVFENLIDIVNYNI